MIALLSDKVEFGRVEQPTRLAAMKVMQATRKVFMKRDYNEFPNNLVPACNAVPIPRRHGKAVHALRAKQGNQAFPWKSGTGGEP
jgi:hypothetical protein